MRLALIAALAVPLVATAATAVVAQTNVIQERRAAMKDIGEQAKAMGAMVKGDVAFDAAKAEAAFKVFTASGAKFGTLFPEGSNTGETKATAAVWSDRAGFDAELQKFNAAVAANVDKVGTADGLKTAMTAVGGTCRACHQGYTQR
ncbi:c-type cytochrome [Xanthobacteraceae bacterium A53D]